MECGCLHVALNIRLLEQGVDDEELMLSTELRKLSPVVIAVANSVST